MPLLKLPPDFTKFDIRYYGGKGNGEDDDTVAFQEMMWEARKGMNPNNVKDFFHHKPKTVFLPKGIWLISDAIEWFGQCMMIQGQGTGQTIIQLQSKAPKFSDALKPLPMIQTPDGIHQFRNYIRDLTIRTGKGNPGAIALDFIANNSGGIINVDIVDQGNSHTGISMLRYAPGPMLIKNVNITGFDIGMDIFRREYCITMQDIGLAKQRVVGIVNDGNVVSIEGLTSVNSVPVIQTRDSTSLTTILHARLTKGKPGTPAIINEKGHVYLRDISSTGYGKILNDRGTPIAESYLDEYHTGKEPLFTTPKLDHEPSPEYTVKTESQWQKLNDPVSWPLTFQSGKPAYYLECKLYNNAEPVVVDINTSVRLLNGFGGAIAGTPIDIVVEKGNEKSPPLIIEHVGFGLRIHHMCKRPIIIRHTKLLGYHPTIGAGKVWIDDIELHVPLYIVKGQQVIARQLNMEGENRIINTGGYLWVLGMKTERKGNVVSTFDWGTSEVIGGLLYPVREFVPTDVPAFYAKNAFQSIIIGTSNYYKVNGMYPVLIKDEITAVDYSLPGNQGMGRWVALHSTLPTT